MTNLSLLSRLSYLLLATASIALLMFLAEIPTLIESGFHGAEVLKASVLTLVSVFAVLGYKDMRKLRATLHEMSSVCVAAAKGDMEARICGEPEAGELGVLQKNLNQLLDISDAFVREASGAMASVAKGRYYRPIMQRGLPGFYQHAAGVVNSAISSMSERTKEFERFARDNVGVVMSSVSAAAVEMQNSAESLSSSASESNLMASTVSSAATQATANVQSVAASAEELASSVNEISRRVSESSSMTRQAVVQATDTNEKIRGLSEAANRIGDVVELITKIAEQTNLLALNATIEAARAGESGRGFAIVASEVKELAGQTARATEDIRTQIEAIQSSTVSAVDAIGLITTTIEQVDAIATAIASAVEEQGAATQEIARNVSEAATGTSEVSDNIIKVSDAAKETGFASSQVLDAAKELAEQANLLGSQLDEFLNKSMAA